MITLISRKPSVKDLEKIFNASKLKKRGVDVKKYSGKIKSKGSPVELQRKLRNEWE